MSRIFFGVAIALLVAAGAAALALGSVWSLGGVSQPVAFPHKTHAGTLSLPCTTCHQRAEKDAVAGRPPTALCLGCHLGGDTQSAEIKKIRAFGEQGQEIPWRRVWRLPPHVFFPHRVHVTTANIACQTCHGPMETLDRPPRRPLKTLAMDDCIGCHAARRQSTVIAAKTVRPTKLAAHRMSADCVMCHR